MYKKNLTLLPTPRSKCHKESAQDNIRVSAWGWLDLEWNWIWTEHHAQKNNFDISKFNTATDLAQLFEPENETLLNMITLTSSNRWINILLFINRVYKQKTFIELIVLSKLSFSNEKKFIHALIREVTERNFWFIIENPIINIKPNLKFNISVISDTQNEVVQARQFEWFEENIIWDLYEREGYSWYNAWHYCFNCSFFIADFSDLCSLTGYSSVHTYSNIIGLFNEIKQENPTLNIILSLMNNDLKQDSTWKVLNTRQELLSIVDVTFMEKKDEMYYTSVSKDINDGEGNDNINAYNQWRHNRSSNNNNKKKNVNNVRIRLHELQNVYITQIEGKAITFNEEYIIDWINNEDFNLNMINEKKHLIERDYEYFTAVFIGGFWSRFIYNKTFNTCFYAGNAILNKMLELKKYNIDFITDISFFHITVPKNWVNKEEDADYLIEEKEKGFILDCVNKEKSKKHIYNSLYDKTCQEFFSIKSKFKHWKNFGFINKQGVVLKEPKFNRPLKTNHGIMVNHKHWFTKKEKSFFTNNIYLNAANGFNSAKNINKTIGFTPKITNNSIINNKSKNKETSTGSTGRTQMNKTQTKPFMKIDNDFGKRYIDKNEFKNWWDQYEENWNLNNIKTWSNGSNNHYDC